MRFLQAVPLHLWRRGKWGNSRLDCRECWLCRRFEVWFIFDWDRRDRADFPDAVFP